MNTPLTHTQTPQPEYVFDLDAGVVCLDFVNTLISSAGDHITSFADLVSFARQSHVLTPVESDRLQRQGARHPDQASQTLEHAKRLRNALFEVFRRVAADEEPRAADLAVLNEHLGRAMAHACLEQRGGALVWSWCGDDLDRAVWPIVRSAADLLTSDTDRAAVRECGASDCLWLFLDSSKNRSRQWCSMQICGNREKARRHYQRLKARRAGSHAS